MLVTLSSALIAERHCIVQLLPPDTTVSKASNIHSDALLRVTQVSSIIEYVCAPTSSCNL
jgi:hypothetical protein